MNTCITQNTHTMKHIFIFMGEGLTLHDNALVCSAQ